MKTRRVQYSEYSGIISRAAIDHPEEQGPSHIGVVEIRKRRWTGVE